MTAEHVHEAADPRGNMWHNIRRERIAVFSDLLHLGGLNDCPLRPIPNDIEALETETSSMSVLCICIFELLRIRLGASPH